MMQGQVAARAAAAAGKNPEDYSMTRSQTLHARRAVVHATGANSELCASVDLGSMPASFFLECKATQLMGL